MNKSLLPVSILGLLAAFAASPAVATPPGMGACCVEGICHVDSEAACDADGGLYLGDGTNCGGVSCGCEQELADSQVFPGSGAPELEASPGWSGPALSYTDNGDGTVTDNNTQLMWEVKTNDQANGCIGDGGADLHAVGATCTWQQATEDWIDALDVEGGTGYAGYSDWRLPNVKELQSIVDYGQWPAPTIDPTFPGATATSGNWSATTFAGNTTLAWGVYFGDGFVFNSYKFRNRPVRAVRGGR